MMNLNSPVTAVPKIGPKYKTLLEKLGIKTVRDLLYHFPFRYDDLSQTKPVVELVLNDVVTITATLNSVDNIFTRNRKKITKAIFSDETGKIGAIWFNMHYIKKNLLVGERYGVSGRVGISGGKLGFVSPQIERLGNEDGDGAGSSVHTGRLVPIYPETYGVSSKWLRTRISEVLTVLGGLADLEEFLPESVLDKYGFMGFEKALRTFHFPDSLEEASEAKKRFAYEELFVELLKVEGRKDAWEDDLKGHEMVRDGKVEKKLNAFTSSLPFALTESQKEALETIFNDMVAKHPMNRLLEGDTGVGKTVVAVISAYFAYLNGYKTLYMAPTEILAQQQFETLKNYLEPLGAKVILLTGATKATKTSKKLPEGADIIIGTHALIYLEEKIKDVGLIVIDEQQRFGVEQRAKLLELGTKGKIPHLLTMTATPIPRTLALTLYGDLDISSVKPHKSRYDNIKTWILSEKKRADAYGWASTQNVPIFVVCPLIEASDHEMLENVRAAEVEFESLRNGPFKNLTVGLLHGRMKAKEKEDIVSRFRGGKLQALVATPVIEVGIDIPDATIMMIESAERYGLASLHQLRGRVGRTGQQAYCLLFMSKYSKTGFQRLKNLEKYHSGLKLAEIDMGLRGQGDLYGTMQHGFVEFKVADPSDFEALEAAKVDAESYYSKLSKYPKLKEKLKETRNTQVAQN
ncbi:hypothetical protein A2886_02500 [candidate division WWE3 bacterium RIFCSPHIGHO2_01_FULL_42_13]|uniref:Uncharacterized protein n=1 Tax=candidate division WWE3 bacterium RIFCSPHIGHO2_01_FULL_42_13 TaxID=1802617 RepID=A0A1F4URV1_UNCKA|nr:MAG: hypothetical protein A2886_02500 [candidate division WWE3 bacterium RIFCSPHIGHO2_01_FULL_42_13]